MDMSLQTIYYAVGVGGLVLGVLLALAAIAYYVRADIRAVRADLSGKARQAQISDDAAAVRAPRKVLTKEEEWQGQISYANFTSRTADTADATGTGSSDSGASGARAGHSASALTGGRQFLSYEPSKVLGFAVNERLIVAFSQQIVGENGGWIDIAEPGDDIAETVQEHLRGEDQ